MLTGKTKEGLSVRQRSQRPGSRHAETRHSRPLTPEPRSQFPLNSTPTDHIKTPQGRYWKPTARSLDNFQGLYISYQILWEFLVSFRKTQSGINCVRIIIKIITADFN